MTNAEGYDLIAILAGDKDSRHSPARTLLSLGWAAHIVVTGEHETIDPGPPVDGRVLVAPPSRSTFEDVRAIREVMERHGFQRVLVVTAASQAPRARLALAREFRTDVVVADVLSWESAGAGGRLRALRSAARELVTLGWYLVRGRA